MSEDEDRRREHLIAINERLAVVQHQLAEVQAESLRRREGETAGDVAGVSDMIDLARRLLVRLVNRGALPA